MTHTTPAGESTGATSLPSRTKSLILTVVLIGYFMLLLDNSIIFTGIPQVQRELDLSAVGLSWVQNAYTLVFGGLLLLAARAGDLLDRGRLLLVGLGIFGLASLLVGVAPTEWWIITARGLQGVGAAIVAPACLALITTTFEAGPARTKAVAAYGLMAGGGASLGLVVGGALASAWSWRVGFLINVPIAIMLIIIAARVIPREQTRRGRFDLFGAIASTAGMGALVFGITSGGDVGWSSPVTLGCIAAGAVILALFVIHERHTQQPILPLRIFASRQRTGAAIARLMLPAAMIAFYFFTSQFFQGVYGWTPLQAGLAFLPMTIVQFAAGLLVPRLTARLGNSGPLLVGMLILLGGLVWLTQLDDQLSYWVAMAGPLALLGVGQGLVFGPLTSAGVAGAAGDDAGAASGLVNSAHQLGSTLGIAVLTTVAAGASTLTGRTVDVYIGGSIILGVALAAIVFLILPGERADNARRKLGTTS